MASRKTLHIWVAVDEDGNYRVHEYGASDATQLLHEDEGGEECVDVYRIDLDVPIPGVKTVPVTAQEDTARAAAGIFKIKID